MPESAVAVRPVARDQIAVITEALEKRTAALADVLPPSMSVERFKRVSLMALSKNPELLQCTPESVIRGIIEAAEIGLEPTGSLDRAWLVPFKPKDRPKEAQLIIGYQGLQDLARDSGKVSAVWTGVVFEGDEFVEEGGTSPRIVHRPAHATEDPAKIGFFYAVAQYTDGTKIHEVMSKAQVDVIRAKSKNPNGMGWTGSYPQMGRKTAMRRLSNSLPLTPRAIAAIVRDDEREFGDLNASAAPVAQAPTIRAALAQRRAARIAPGAEKRPQSDDEPKLDDEPQAAPAPRDGPEPVAVAVCGLIPPGGNLLGFVEPCTEPTGHSGAHKSNEGSWPQA